jgi:hypothetical protein
MRILVGGEGGMGCILAIIEAFPRASKEPGDCKLDAYLLYLTVVCAINSWRL